MNLDPFAGTKNIGRVRRLYVAVRDRRSGVGTAVIGQLMADSRGVFDWLHLRTYDRDAAAFYEAVGFDPVIGDENYTHRHRVVA
jgi:predicted acetyltransferase